MRVDITATDRNGRVLETRTVRGTSFRDTFDDRGRVYNYFKSTYRDHSGVGPYIFTSTVYDHDA